MAKMSLLFAVWSIVEVVPFFAVDAFSETEAGFQVPSRAIPVLLDLILEKERSTSQQFCMSLNESWLSGQ
jgi:hypothetical protein